MHKQVAIALADRVLINHERTERRAQLSRDNDLGHGSEKKTLNRTSNNKTAATVIQRIRASTASFQPHFRPNNSAVTDTVPAAASRKASHNSTVPDQTSTAVYTVATKRTTNQMGVPQRRFEVVGDWCGSVFVMHRCHGAHPTGSSNPVSPSSFFP
jgi:hypothetical protein